MNSLSISFALAVIVVTSHLVLGLIVFLKNPRDVSHRWFLAMTISIAGWSSAGILVDEAAVYNLLGDLVQRVELFIGSLGTFAYFGFTVFFVRRVGFITNSLLFVLGIISLTFGVLAVVTDLMISHAYFDVNELRYVPGPLDSSYAVFLFLLLLGGIWVLIRKYKESKDIDRIKVEYILTAVSVPVVIIAFLLVCITRLYDLHLLDTSFPIILVAHRISIASTLFLTSVTAYAIVWQQLFGIRVVLGRLVFWFSLSIILFSIFYATLLAELHFFGSIVLPEPIIFNVVLAVVIGMFLSAFESQFRRFVERAFIFTSYDPRDVVAELKTKTLDDNDLTDSACTVLEYINRYMQPQMQGVVITTDSDVWSEWRGQVALESSILEDPEFLTILFSHVKPGTYVRPSELAFIRGVSESLLSHEIVAVFAIGERGLYFLGTRSSGKLYTDEELRLIKQMLAAITL